VKEEKIIVKRKEIETKPMNEEEAVLQMELIGHEFYIFKNADNGKTSVVYKRKDNNYGIIDIK
jgi:putative sigma-54 modulation protein